MSEAEEQEAWESRAEEEERWGGGACLFRTLSGPHSDRLLPTAAHTRIPGTSTSSVCTATAAPPSATTVAPCSTGWCTRA